MNKLEQYRKQINQIDKEIAKLYKKRMGVVKSIALYKQKNKLPIYDLSREKQIFALCQKHFSHKDNTKKYFPTVLKSLLKVSKQYQKDLVITNKSK